MKSSHPQAWMTHAYMMDFTNGHPGCERIILHARLNTVIDPDPCPGLVGTSLRDTPSQTLEVVLFHVILMMVRGVCIGCLYPISFSLASNFLSVVSSQIALFPCQATQ